MDPVFSQALNVVWLDRCDDTGVAQMAYDEALLDWLLEQPAPILVFRTYTWAQPTWSLGVHQSEGDLPAMLQSQKTDANPHLFVRRPTGGRAILHGQLQNQDVSFCFATNDPVFRQQSLKDSYCVLTRWVKQALEACGVPLQNSCQTDERAYTVSAQCFETQTPSDLLDQSGQKVCGSAQLRRAKGLLQHGAAFLKPYGVSADLFNQALGQAVSNAFSQQEITTTTLAHLKKAQPGFQDHFLRCQKACQTEANRLEALAAASLKY